MGRGGVAAATHQRASSLVANQAHRRHGRSHHPPLQPGGAADTFTVMGLDAPVIGVVRLDALNSESVVPLIVPPDTTAVVAPLVCSGR